jgi:hypothetical protein
MTDLSRRTIIKGTGAIGAAMLPAALQAKTARAEDREPGAPGEGKHRPSAGVSHERPSTTYLFFNTEEAAFIEAAVARFARSPSGMRRRIAIRRLEPRSRQSGDSIALDQAVR